jgi:diaminopimelate epimerase
LVAAVGLSFDKYEGLGNDFILIESTDEASITPERAAELCDRRFGVGADGVLLLLPPRVAGCAARMRVLNADGSLPEMCGNGVRCVAKYLFDHGLKRKKQLAIETGRGILTLDLEVADGRAQRVRVDMGAPILQAAEIPTRLPGNPPLDVPIIVHEFTLTVSAISMGNPHLVTYVPDVNSFPLESLGPLIEHHQAFPRRVNVHAVEIKSPSEVTMRTWERGSGITLACGTGACAVCVAGVLTGRTGRTLIAHLKGGDLELNWPADGASVFMTGAATEVFSGEWPD